MRNFYKLRQLFVILLLTFSLSSCVPLLITSAIGGAGVYVWNKGHLELPVNYSTIDLYDAVRESLEDLNIMIERDRHDRFKVDISGRNSVNQKVLVKIIGQTEKTSLVRVRVGVLGSLEQSQILMSVILKNVKSKF